MSPTPLVLTARPPLWALLPTGAYTPGPSLQLPSPLHPCLFSALASLADLSRALPGKPPGPAPSPLAGAWLGRHQTHAAIGLCQPHPVGGMGARRQRSGAQAPSQPRASQILKLSKQLLNSLLHNSRWVTTIVQEKETEAQMSRVSGRELELQSIPVLCPSPLGSSSVCPNAPTPHCPSSLPPEYPYFLTPDEVFLPRLPNPKTLFFFFKEKEQSQTLHQCARIVQCSPLPDPPPLPLVLLTR